MKRSTGKIFSGFLGGLIIGLINCWFIGKFDMFVIFLYILVGLILGIVMILFSVLVYVKRNE